MTTPRKTAARIAHEADIQTIAETLRDAAVEHDLCDAFWDVVEELNANLTVPLPISRNMTIRLNVVVEVTRSIRAKSGRYGDQVPDQDELDQIVNDVKYAVRNIVGLGDVDESDYSEV